MSFLDKFNRNVLPDRGSNENYIPSGRWFDTLTLKVNELKDSVDGVEEPLRFTGEAERLAYLLNPNRIAGVIATSSDKEGYIFILNNAKTAWIEFDAEAPKLVDGIVDYYSELPDPTLHNQEIWMVRFTTLKFVFFTDKEGGLYYSNGATWAWIPSSISANKITYDNTISGLTTINVQDAIDELKSEKLDVTKVAVSTALMTEQAVGFTLEGGTTKKTLTVPLDASVSGTNTGDQDVSGFLKLDQTVKQTLTASPIINNLTAKRIPFAATDKSLTDSSIFVWDDVNKRLGVGTASPSSRMHIKETSLLNNIGTEFLNIELSQTTSVTGTYTSRNIYAITNRNVNTGIADSSTVFGAQFSAYCTGNVHRGTLSRLVGTTYIAGIVGTGTTGTITRVEALNITPYAQSGTIGTFYGLYINQLSGSGTVTNKYAIYSNFDAPSYLTGALGLGIDIPTQKLDVVGNIKASGSAQVGTNTDAASATNVGALRYRTSGNNSYVDMSMQTGASTYSWINIVTNTW